MKQSPHVIVNYNRVYKIKWYIVKELSDDEPNKAGIVHYGKRDNKVR